MAPSAKALAKAAEKAALEVGEAARLARAKKMGFDTSKTYFHGTKANIEAFDPTKSGSSSGAGRGTNVSWFSDNPKVAEEFAAMNWEDRKTTKFTEEFGAIWKKYGSGSNKEGNLKISPTGQKKLNDLEDAYGADPNTRGANLNRHPDLKDVQKEIRAREKELNYDGDLYKSDDKLKKLRAREDETGSTLREIIKGRDQNILPVHLKYKNPKVLDLNGKFPKNRDEIVRKAAKEGHDAVIFKNSQDSREGTNSDVVAVFKPEQVRSKFAEFNTRKAKSGLISAGIGGAAIGGALAASGNEAEAGESKDMTRQEKESAARAKWLGSLSREEKIALAQQKWASMNPTPEASSEVPAANQAETGIRSALSSATLGLTEPLISGANALVGQGIEAAYAPEGERLGAFSPDKLSQAYQADVARRESLQQQAPIADIVGSVGGAFSPVGPAAALFRGAQGAAAGVGALDKFGRLAPIAKAGLGAGAGIGASVIAEQNVLRGTGFETNEEGPIGQSLTGGGVAAGIAAVPMVGRGLSTGAKAAFRPVFGVRSETVDAFLKNSEELKNAKTPEQLTAIARSAVGEIKERAKVAQLNLVDEIQNGLATLEQKVGDSSAVSHEILAASGKTFNRDELASAAETALSRVKRTGTIGPEAQGAAARLQEMVDLIRGLPETLDGSAVKRIVQSFDAESNAKRVLGQQETLGEQLLLNARRNIDQVLKKSVPEYGKQMEEVSNLTGLLKESSKLVAGDQKAFGLLNRMGNAEQAVQSQKLHAFMDATGINPANFQKLQAEAAEFKNWKDEGSVQSKVNAMLRGGNPALKNKVDLLTQLSGNDFSNEIRMTGLARQFDLEFTHGAGNTLFWAALGGFAGMSTGGFIPGIALGAATGKFMDRYGPVAAKKILQGVVNIQGIPTVQKLRQLDIPEEAKKDLIDGFTRSFTEYKSSKDPVVIPPDKVAEVRSLIQKSEMDSVQKAKALKEINEHGHSTVMPELMTGQTQMPKPTVVQAPTKPNGPSVKTLSNFIEGKRAEKY